MESIIKNLILYRLSIKIRKSIRYVSPKNDIDKVKIIIAIWNTKVPT